MQVGLLFMGDEEEEIWGSAITTHYLAKAFSEVGHHTWRASATHESDWSNLPERSDLVISEGVPADKIPKCVWQTTDCITFWWLSKLYYDETTISTAPFHAVATNASGLTTSLRRKNVPFSTIELAAPRIFAESCHKEEYQDVCTFLGTCENKCVEQLELLLRPAAEYGLSIWGYGWEDSPFAEFYRGPLPLFDVGRLYRSVQVVLAVTENRQKDLGMINNRIFEALAAGAIVISDPHPALKRHELGEFVHFADSLDSVRQLLDSLMTDSSRKEELKEQAKKGQQAVLSRHTYHHRTDQFVHLYHDAIRSK